MKRYMLCYRALDTNCLYGFSATSLSLLLCTGLWGCSLTCYPSPGTTTGCVTPCPYSLAPPSHSLVVWPCVDLFHTLPGNLCTHCSLYICCLCHPHSLVFFCPLPQIPPILWVRLNLSSPTEPSQRTLSTATLLNCSIIYCLRTTPLTINQHLPAV